MERFLRWSEIIYIEFVILPAFTPVLALRSIDYAINIYGRRAESTTLALPTISTMDSSALLAHILSQTKQNIEFLASQNKISPSDARDIIAKLPQDPSVGDITRSAQICLYGRRRRLQFPSHTMRLPLLCPRPRQSGDTTRADKLH